MSGASVLTPVAVDLDRGVVPTVTVDVYVRYAAEAASRLNGESDGYALVYDQVCEVIKIDHGATMGLATFTVLPPDGELGSLEQVAIEDARSYVEPGSHVKVVGYPIDFGGGEESSGEVPAELVLFEGVVLREELGIGDDFDDIGWRAVPLPYLDETTPDHQIAGRWMPQQGWSDTGGSGGGETSDLLVPETPSLPAVFNFRGRPNKHGTAKLRAGGGEGADYLAPVFTHDADPDGTMWTFGEAVLSVLGMWLYGPAHPSSASLSRTCCLHPDAIAGLAAPAEGSTTPAAFVGFDAVLPEVNVQGMGPLRALQALCDAAGWVMVVEPDFDGTEGVDRTYVIRLVNRQAEVEPAPEDTSGGGGASGASGGSGGVAPIKLKKRKDIDSDEPSGSQQARDNTISAALLVRDAGRCVNRVRAVARQLIETTVELLPLWSPDDVFADTVSQAMQLARPTTVPSGYAAYYDRHVSGGAEYDRYGQVGRRWGVDCTGAFAAVGYTSGGYQHPEGGFDWATQLGLGGDTPLTQARAAANLGTQLAWSTRVRPLLPLTRAGRRGGLIVEVSEDGGSSWGVVPVQARSLDGFCGIELSNLPNLARINREAILGGVDCPVEASWWALLRSGDLRFRVTGVVEADHAAGHLALATKDTGTVYPREARLLVSGQEVWSSPSSVINTSGDWERVQPWGGLERDETEGLSLSLQSLAERKRDAFAGLGVQLDIETWLMMFTQFRVGQAATAIAGRDVSLSTSVFGGSRFPIVESVELVLYPEDRQMVRAAISDRLAVGGTAASSGGTSGGGGSGGGDAYSTGVLPRPINTDLAAQLRSYLIIDEGGSH
ncbi:MAG: hypothetical protein AAF797_07020 [Planctomycetota bacterium]